MIDIVIHVAIYKQMKICRNMIRISVGQVHGAASCYTTQVLTYTSPIECARAHVRLDDNRHSCASLHTVPVEKKK